MTRKALIVTNSEDVTTDYLCDRLNTSQVPFIRIDTDSFLNCATINLASAKGVISSDGAFTLSSDEVSALIIRRPKPLVPLIDGDKYQKNHASSEWAEAIEGFFARVPMHRWINHPSRNFLASHKVEQLDRASASGLRVPKWIVTSSAEQAKTFHESMQYKLIAKPLSSGYIERDVPERDSLIYTCGIDNRHVELFDCLPACPVLFQERIEKAYDVRLVVLSGEMVAVSLHAKDSGGQQRLDIRRNSMIDVKYGCIEIPDHIRTGVEKIMQEYGLAFGALDFAVTGEGEWVFFEINPNGQWAWLDLEAGTRIDLLFAKKLRELQ